MEAAGPSLTSDMWRSGHSQHPNIGRLGIPNAVSGQCRIPRREFELRKVSKGSDFAVWGGRYQNLDVA